METAGKMRKPFPFSFTITFFPIAIPCQSLVFLHSSHTWIHHCQKQHLLDMMQ